VQIVIAVSVLMAVGLAILDHAFLAPYDSVFGQLVLAVIVAIYALGIIWLRKLARFDMPQRLLGAATTVPVPPQGPAGPAGPPGSQGFPGGQGFPGAQPAEPETVSAWRGGST
jgi:hypothetical protein